jgi:hypothetical protein
MIQWPGERRSEQFTHEPHTWKPMRAGKGRSLPWLWCPRCGLVRLRNARTEWCIDHGCNYDDHPGYKQAMRRETA